MFESEERRIVKRIKDFIKDEEPPNIRYIMLRNGRIIDIDNYRKMVNAGKINPQDAYVDIGIELLSSRLRFRYPFLVWYGDFLDAYLSKLGFYYGKYVFPATGLKYIADAEVYGRYLSIEVVNLDIAANNTNLPNIVVEVLGEKLISGERELTEEEYDKIRDMFISQRLFVERDFYDAQGKISDYYYEDNQSLAKEVARITMDYIKIFNPYTVCYDMNNWKEVDCSLAKF